MKKGETWSRLYLTHRPALIDYAMRIVGSRDLAEDVVQDVFLKFVPTGAEGLASPKAYLFRVVRNLAFDLNRRRRMEQRQAKEPPDWVYPSAGADPEHAILFCDEIRRVSDILATMPEDVRIAVEMHRFGGYRLEDIASHLGVSTPTVHRMIRKAIAELAERMGRSRH